MVENRMFNKEKCRAVQDFIYHESIGLWKKGIRHQNEATVDLSLLWINEDYSAPKNHTRWLFGSPLRASQLFLNLCFFQVYHYLLLFTLLNFNQQLGQPKWRHLHRKAMVSSHSIESPWEKHTFSIVKPVALYHLIKYTCN